MNEIMENMDEVVLLAYMNDGKLSRWESGENDFLARLTTQRATNDKGDIYRLLSELAHNYPQAPLMVRKGSESGTYFIEGMVVCSTLEKAAAFCNDNKVLRLWDCAEGVFRKGYDRTAVDRQTRISGACPCEQCALDRQAMAFAGHATGFEELIE